jgi:DNA modification methylase
MNQLPAWWPSDKPWIIADCLDVMRKMPDKCVDLTVTSPRYNLGNNHHTGNHRFNPYPDDTPEPEYRAEQIEILNELYRITKVTGSILYNHKNRIKEGVQITPYEWLLKTKWLIKQEIVWFNGSQNFDKIRFFPMTERIYWLSKDKGTVLSNTINHHDVFSREEWPVMGSNDEHKRAFPDKLVVDLLSCFPDAQIVFDPFLGSGTTLLACRKTGRIGLGCEINPDYEAIIRKRSMQNIAKLEMF